MLHIQSYERQLVILKSIFVDQDEKLLEHLHVWSRFIKQSNSFLFECFITQMVKNVHTHALPVVCSVSVIPVARLVPESNIAAKSCITAHLFNAVMVLAQGKVSCIGVWTWVSTKIDKGLVRKLELKTVLFATFNRKACSRAWLEYPESFLNLLLPMLHDHQG